LWGMTIVLVEWEGGRGGAIGKKLERSVVSDSWAGGRNSATIDKTADVVAEGEYSNKWLHMFHKSSRWIHQS